MALGLFQNAGFFCQLQKAVGEFLKILVDGPGTGNEDDIPAGSDPVFIQTIDLPKAAADPIADHSMTQLFADGDAHPIGGSPVFPGVEDDHAIGTAVGAIKPLKYVVKLQRAGIFHKNSSKQACSQKKLSAGGRGFQEYA